MKNVSMYNFLCCFITFILGVIYLSFPTYYGLDMMSKIETGNLIISFLIIYSLVNLSVFFINHERYNLKLSVISSISCLISFILTKYIHAFLVTPVSIMVFLFFISSLKTIDIFNLKYEKDNYYMKVILLVILDFFGIILAFNMLNDFVLQTIMLGFFISLISAIDFVDYSLEYLIKNKYIKVMK